MRSEPGCSDRGSVTAEMAVALPVLVLVVAAAVSAVLVAGARVRASDAAREAARASARGDAAAARVLVERSAPGSTYSLNRSGPIVIATVRVVVHPLASWLPAVAVTESAVAMAEPTTTAPP